MRPTRERLEEIKRSLTLREIGPFNEEMVKELFSEIEALETENKKLKPIWDPGIQLMRDDFHKIAKERDRLKERVAKLTEIKESAQDLCDGSEEEISHNPEWQILSKLLAADSAILL